MIKLNLRNSDTKKSTVGILYIVYKHLRPPTGVKAGKRNKTSPLDDRFCRSAHCLWAAVAQVVLVVRELLLVSEWCKILGWETGSSQGTNVLKDCCKPESQVTWYLLTIPFSRPIYSFSLPGHSTVALCCRSAFGHSDDWFVGWMFTMNGYG